MQISNFDCRSNFVLATHCVGKNCFVEYQHNFVNLITSLCSIQFIDAAVFNPITSLQPTQYPILFYSILFYSILFYSILFYSILFYSILFYSILFYSILFYSILFYSILFYSIPIHPIPPHFVLFKMIIP